MADKKLQIVIDAQDRASKEFKNVSRNIEGTNKGLQNMKKYAGLASVAVVALAGKMGFDAVKSATKFNKSMSNVSTLLDTNVESMEDMKNEVLDLAKKTPVALDDLSSSLYDIRSAGISAEGAMDTLNASAKLAVAGLGSTKDATNILTSAINAFGLEAKDGDKWADVFFKTVKSGKTTVEELSQGFGQLAPLANSVGVEFEEMMAITSSMTTSGLRASVAYSQQRAMLSNLLKPTAEMQTLMKKLNIEDIKSKIEKDGLVKTIRELSEATDGNNEMLAKAFGSVEGLNAVMMLMNETGDSAINIHKDMTEGADALTEAYAKQRGEASAMFQEFKNKWEVIMVNLGNKLLPPILSAMNWLGTTGAQMWQNISNNVRNLFGETSVFRQFLEVTFIPMIMSLKETWTESWNNMKTSLEPIMPILSMFGKLIGGLLVGVLLVLVKVFTESFKVMAKILEGFVNIFSGVIRFFQGLFSALTSGMLGDWDGMVAGLTEMLDGFKSFVAGIAKIIFSPLASNFNSIKEKIGGYIEWISGKLEGLMNFAKKVIDKFRKADDKKDDNRATGGVVMPRKAYTVGERGPETFIPNVGGKIVNARETASAKGGGGNVFNFNFAGATIGNRQELIREIESVINRRSELISIGIR